MIRSVGDQDRTAAAGLRLSSSPSHSGRQSPRSRLSRGKQAGPPQGDRAPLSPRSRNHPQGGDGDRTSADTDEAPRLSGTLHDRRDLSTTAHSTVCPPAATDQGASERRGEQSPQKPTSHRRAAAENHPVPSGENPRGACISPG
ncbi:hypothetical protein GN956_G20021 [Arapaima gigas]